VALVGVVLGGAQLAVVGDLEEVDDALVADVGPALIREVALVDLVLEHPAALLAHHVLVSTSWYSARNAIAVSCWA
jgi:hypothetical protein